VRFIPSHRSTFNSRARGAEGQNEIDSSSYCLSSLSQFFVLSFSLQQQTIRLRRVFPDAHGSFGYGVGNVKSPHNWKQPITRAYGQRFQALTEPISSPFHRAAITSFQSSSFVARDVVLDLAAGENRTLDFAWKLERLSENVVVHANAEPLAVDHNPAPVDLIGRQEIDQRQAVSLPIFCPPQTGISLARTGLSAVDHTIRDGRQFQLQPKILIDGTPINSRRRHETFQPHPRQRGQVEIVHGAESALYGSRHGPVVQIVSHQGPRISLNSTCLPKAAAFPPLRVPGNSAVFSANSITPPPAPTFIRRSRRE